MSGKRIHHRNTPTVVCPRCGWRELDSWERNDDGEVECPRCDLAFTYQRHVTITFTTEEVTHA